MKNVLILFLLLLFLGIGGTLLLFRNNALPEPDVIAINDAVITAMQSGNQNEAVNRLTQQILIEQDSIEAVRKNRDSVLQAFLLIYMGIVAAVGVGLYWYCERSVLTPFRRLQRFAKDIAAGNLDIPLAMDRHGRFGAFTESFDLMREELKKARENERNADRSKKELVASISHDIKTPVASIKAATEFMLIAPKDEKDRRQLVKIGEKADQINALITDMFHATLEELQALSVSAAEIHSTAITELIQNADYKGHVKPFVIPSCIIIADAVRLQQIFDNIIGNSYKYAFTAIEVNAAFEGQNLVVEITDSGNGVPNDELPLIFNKFYRGKNASDKSGYGLGLYIAKNLLTQMSGHLGCENRTGCFAVILSFCLAG